MIKSNSSTAYDKVPLSQIYRRIECLLSSHPSQLASDGIDPGGRTKSSGPEVIISCTSRNVCELHPTAKQNENSELQEIEDDETESPSEDEVDQLQSSNFPNAEQKECTEDASFKDSISPVSSKESE